MAFVPAKPLPAELGKAYLESLGWEMGGSFWEEMVVLPKETDKVWMPYIEMQKEAGFDLLPYCGQKVLRLSCPISNYPDVSGVQATLYYDGNTLIGGDIYSPALDGFMHALSPRESDTF